MELRRLLLASGDVEFIEQITAALDGRGFSIQAAYSHKDALYLLRSETYALLIVDGRLVQRDTNETSVSYFQRISPRLPMVVYSQSAGLAHHEGLIQVATTDEITVRATVMRALRIPRVGEPLAGVVKPVPEVSAADAGAQREEPPTSIYWRDDQIKTLFALSRSLTEVLDLSEVLNRVVEAARHLTNAEEGMILLPDDHSVELYLRARVGMDAQVAENFRIKTQDTLAGSVFTTGQAVLINADQPQKIKTEYFVRALLYVPILLNSIPLGVLGVNNRVKRDPFTDRHLELLVNLASYAAIAINNARTHGESLRRTTELKLLMEATQAMNATLSFEKTLLAVAENLARVLNVHISALFDFSPDQRTLHLRAMFKQARWRSGTEEVVTLKQEWLDVLVRSGSAVLAHSRPGSVPLLRRAGACHALLLPVMQGEAIFGILVAYSVRVPPSELPRPRLQRAQRALADHAQLLIGGTSDRMTFNALHVLGDLRAVLDADSLEFMVATPDPCQLRVRYAYGGMVWPASTDAASSDADDMPSLPFSGEFTFGFTTDDEISHETASAMLSRYFGFSVQALPVKVRGQLQGLAVMVDTMRPRSFLKREIDLARTLLGQAGMAVDNAQLVVDLERSLRELRNTQEKLVQSARLSAMGELAAAVAHQINNPLTTIVLDSELLIGDHLPGTPTHDALSAILRAGKRASGVVRRLLSSARPGSENEPPVPVDVIGTLQETIALVKPYFDRAAIVLHVNAPEALPPVMAPPGALDDVWLNLLLNAHDVLVGRADARVEVIIQLYGEPPQIDVAICDNGPGVPVQNQERIFEPFFTTKAHGEGTGLGLYICKQIITRAGGEIFLDNAPQGAAFVVRLPAQTVIGFR